MKALPNILTLSRIIVIPLLVFISFLTVPYKFLILLFIYILASITDFFDGHLARKYNYTSHFGRIMDPISDKLLVASVIVILLVSDVIGGYHTIAALLIILREITVSGLREFLSEFQVKMPVSMLAKWKTALQMMALVCLLASPDLGQYFFIREIGLGLLWLAAIMTLKTGFDYLRAGFPHMSID